MGDRGGELVDLALERRVVDRIDRRLQVFGEKEPENRMRRHEIDLKARARRNLAGVAQPLEGGVGALRLVGIKEIVEADIGNALARPQLVALARRTGRM